MAGRNWAYLAVQVLGKADRLPHAKSLLRVSHQARERCAAVHRCFSCRVRDEDDARELRKRPDLCERLVHNQCALRVADKDDLLRVVRAPLARLDDGSGELVPAFEDARVVVDPGAVTPWQEAFHIFTQASQEPVRWEDRERWVVQCNLPNREICGERVAHTIPNSTHDSPISSFVRLPLAGAAYTDEEQVRAGTWYLVLSADVRPALGCGLSRCGNARDENRRNDGEEHRGQCDVRRWEPAAGASAMSAHSTALLRPGAAQNVKPRLGYAADAELSDLDMHLPGWLLPFSGDPVVELLSGRESVDDSPT